MRNKLSFIVDIKEKLISDVYSFFPIISMYYSLSGTKLSFGSPTVSHKDKVLILTNHTHFYILS